MAANTDTIMMHGGDLSGAMMRFGGVREDWLDLSSGINPASYPFDKENAFDAIGALPSHQDLMACLGAARSAYGADELVSVVASPGTQALIQAMPVLLGTSQSCLILGPTYSEHQRAMARAGVDVAQMQDVPEAFMEGDCLLIVNPNNPDGRLFEVNALIDLAKRLDEKNGLLIVDEAFIDLRPEASLVPHLSHMPNCIVLRSFGKFFGLGGIRLGFLLGAETLVGRVRDMLGPWAVSTPALRVGAQALADLDWQSAQREKLQDRASRLDALLERFGYYVSGGTWLFRLILVEDAKALHSALAQEHIWTRIFDYRPDFLRLGIPETDADFARLETALKKVASR